MILSLAEDEILTEPTRNPQNGVPSAGIKSQKLLYELKKIYFAVFKRLMG